MKPSFLVLMLVASSARYVPSDQKRAISVEFYKCLGCMEGVRELDAMLEYNKCLQKRPEKSKQAEEDCLEQNAEGKWKTICDDQTVAEKLYDCIMEKEKEHYNTLTEDEKEKLVEFRHCSNKVDDVYCKKIPPVKGITQPRR